MKKTDIKNPKPVEKPKEQPPKEKDQPGSEFVGKSVTV